MDGPLAQSLGVEPVDPEVMARPPRKRHDNILTRPLLNRVFTSGLLILIGTMLVFVTELDNDGTASSRDMTMTFTNFIMFDMFNAVSCRNNNKSVFALKWNANPAFLAALSFCLLGQVAVVYFPPLQAVFRTEALGAMDIGLIITLASTILILDIIRKGYFAHIFTELTASTISGSGELGLQSGREFGTYKYGLSDKIQSLLGGWSPLVLIGGKDKKVDSEGEPESKV